LSFPVAAIAFQGLDDPWRNPCHPLVMLRLDQETYRLVAHGIGLGYVAGPHVALGGSEGRFAGQAEHVLLFCQAREFLEEGRSLSKLAFPQQGAGLGQFVCGTLGLVRAQDLGQLRQ
jgi:hypothetical protein